LQTEFTFPSVLADSRSPPDQIGSSIVSTCNVLYLSQAFVEFILVEANRLIADVRMRLPKERTSKHTLKTCATGTKHSLHSRCRYRFVKEQNPGSNLREIRVCPQPSITSGDLPESGWPGNDALEERRRFATRSGSTFVDAEFSGAFWFRTPTRKRQYQRPAA
jgi:hypothetical protein